MEVEEWREEGGQREGGREWREGGSSAITPSRRDHYRDG